MSIVAAILAQAVTLHLSADPSPLRSGAQAVVTVRGEPGAAPELFTNAGTFEPPREISPGTFVATYHAPDDGIPRVTLIWARAGAARGWLALPLWAEAEATLRGRPGALVAVTVGSTRFGPVRADAAGRATVEVTVPPGIDEARSGPRRIPLHVPPTSTLALAPDLSRARADVEQRVDVTLYAVTPEGLARADARFVLTPDRGSVAPPVAIGPGEYRTTWSLPPGPPGAARLTAALEDRPGQRESVQLALEAGPAERLAFDSAPQAIFAGTEETRLTLRAADRAGNPSAEPLAVSTTFGSVDAERAAPGTWTLRLRVPPRLDGRTELRITAHGASERTLTIPLHAGPPALVEIAAAQRIRADGGAVPVRIALRDAFGNAVNAAPTADATSGTVSTPEARDGAWMATYRPPLLRERGSASIVATAGAARGEARIELLPQEHRLTLSPKLGVVSNFADVHSPLVALEAALRSDRFGPPLELLGELSWSFSAISDRAPLSSGGTVGVRSHTDYVGGALAAGGFLHLDERSRVFLHAGPTLTYVASSLKIGEQPRTSGSAVVPGAQISLGLERRMWRSLPFVEARWSVGGNPSLAGVLDGGTRTFALSLGARFELL